MYRISCVQTFLKFSQLPHWVSNECGDSDNGAADKMRYTFEYNFPLKALFLEVERGSQLLKTNQIVLFVQQVQWHAI